jgi:thioredoxin-related protein
MVNQAENNDELFELNKDLNGLSQYSEQIDLETQLSKAGEVETPNQLKNLIMAKINKRDLNYWRSITLVAAALFITIFGSIILLLIFSKHKIVTTSAIPQPAQKSQDVATILEKELGVSTPKTKKYYALYFSSSLCRPCIDLLNELDRFYIDQKAKNPNFEIVFIELDKHAHLANNQVGLHFKKLEFNDLQDKTFFKQYKDKYGPSFVVIDEKGKIVTKHKKNIHQNTFNTVLTEFSNLLAKS